MKTTFLVLLLGMAVYVNAQVDTTGKGGVDIISAFKPTLKDPVKLKFQATELSFKNDKPVFDYKIPSRQLSFAFTPRPVQPLAYQMDSTVQFDNKGYVKLGYGNLKTPYLEAAVSLGNPNEAGLTVFAKNTSSASSIPYQKFANTNVKINGFAKTTTEHRWDGYLEFNSDKVYQYGYYPANLVIPADSLLRRFNQIETGVLLKPLRELSAGITYEPEIKIGLLWDNESASEKQLSVLFPFSKKVNESIIVKIGAELELANFSSHSGSTVSNNVFRIPAALKFSKKNISVNVGVAPLFKSAEFNLMPNITSTISLNENKMKIDLGWTENDRFNTYQKIIGINPWVEYPEELANTFVDSKYVGISGNYNNHLTYMAKISANIIRDEMFIYNDTMLNSTGKSFLIHFQPEMKSIAFNGELSYQVSNKVAATAGFVFNNYYGLHENEKAWGLLPLELRGSLSWVTSNKLRLNASLNSWSGSHYINRSKVASRLSGAFDVGAGAEYAITNKWHIWAQASNLLNNKYQRWNQYPAYGTNFVGGIVFSFNKK